MFFIIFPSGSKNVIAFRKLQENRAQTDPGSWALSFFSGRMMMLLVEKYQYLTSTSCGLVELHIACSVDKLRVVPLR